MNFRHEIKHEINFSDMIAIRQRLRAVSIPDPHAVEGKYQIRSLYFDNPKDKALREKTDGADRREKFRIRCYNGDLSYIRLEKKSKRNGLCAKRTAPLTVEQTRAILNGEPPRIGETGDPLLREFSVKMTVEGLRPKTIADYTREPYIFPAGNVRVTIDYNIRSGLTCTDFLNPSCVTVPVTHAIILEIKWDEFLPDIIRDAVSLNRRESAFSKYAACRIYG